MEIRMSRSLWDTIRIRFMLVMYNIERIFFTVIPLFFDPLGS